MAHITLKSVGVRFPNYDATARSMKRRIIHSVSGGDLLGESVIHPFVEALASVDLSLAPGDRVALLGGNGTGKTTLIRVLAGLLSPVQGTANIDGHPFAFMNLGFGFSMNESVTDYIVLRAILRGLPRDEIERKVGKVLADDTLKAHEFAPVRALSAGQALRLMFKTEVALDTDIFLFDEVLESGSPEFLGVIANHLSSERQNTAITVMAERSRHILKGICNKAMILERGVITAFGDYDAITTEHGEKFTY